MISVVTVVVVKIMLVWWFGGHDGALKVRSMQKAAAWQPVISAEQHTRSFYIECDISVTVVQILSDGSLQTFYLPLLDFFILEDKS